jgi:sorbitol/mannitol transport system substrate-binding protein
MRAAIVDEPGSVPHPRIRLRTRFRLFAVVATAALTLAGCAGAGALGDNGQTLVVAIVSNSQMTDAIQLSKQFERDHPDIRLKFVTLPENQARAEITASVATGSGEFDVVMISNYETPQWATNGWLTNLEPYIAKTPGYDEGDFIPSIKQSLSYQNSMYAVPFYGESSFLVYRKDLFAKAGLTMPAHPTWQQVASYAAKLDDPAHGVAGICLRGDPGWGESLAPLDTVVNTFGGRWFDRNWNAQLTSPAFEAATNFYVNLVRDHGEVGASSAGFSECGTAYSQGNAAMWYDATSMTGTTEDPTSSKVVGKNGYAPAPVVDTRAGGWLYTWALAIPKITPNKDAAWQFMSWMTDKQYMSLVGNTLGWSQVPPGSRLSTYQIPQYAKAAQAYAKPSLDAIDTAQQSQVMTQPVPYYGLQFVGIPEFQDLGTRVSDQLSAAIAGQETVHQALQQSQEYAQIVGDTYKGTP